MSFEISWAMRSGQAPVSLVNAPSHRVSCQGSPWLLLMLLLGGCASVSDSGCRLLPLRVYDNATQDKVADEVVAASLMGAIWPQFVSDYGALRAAVRACRG